MVSRTTCQLGAVTLDDLRLPSRVNQTWQYTGMDMPDHCWLPDHFHSYPHEVHYQFNSRGFRDDEWPQDLASAVWCIGDSFTVGYGSPREHTWCWLLQQQLGRRCINIAMDGASNDWIARRCCQILQAVGPKLCVIQWSYTHRRELPLSGLDQEIDQRWQPFYQALRAPHWPDCDSFQFVDQLPQKIQSEIRADPYYATLITADDHNRRLDQPGRDAVLNDELNLENFFANLMQVENQRGSTQIIHTFIPHFSADTKTMHQQLMQRGPAHWIPEIKQLDLARDGHHYDILTASELVRNIINIIL